jgi:hypothetical protein
MRLYKSGTGWCVWRWTLTPSDYITRLHLLKTPWFALMVHFINGPDPEPDMHDHPVTFLSLILRGGYSEFRRESGCTVPYVRRWWNFIRATDVHQIYAVRPGTVTFCVVGPKVRDWGFHTSTGWVYWRAYNKKYTETFSGKEVL